MRFPEACLPDYFTPQETESRFRHRGLRRLWDPNPRRCLSSPRRELGRAGIGRPAHANVQMQIRNLTELVWSCWRFHSALGCERRAENGERNQVAEKRQVIPDRKTVPQLVVFREE